MNEIPITVVSNNDDLRRLFWPNYVICRPIIGDNLISTTGRIARICRVSHKRTGLKTTLEVEITI